MLNVSRCQYSHHLSDNLLCKLCKNCNDIVRYAVSILTLVKFSYMYYNYFNLA